MDGRQVYVVTDRDQGDGDITNLMDEQQWWRDPVVQLVLVGSRTDDWRADVTLPPAKDGAHKSTLMDNTQVCDNMDNDGLVWPVMYVCGVCKSKKY